MTTTDPQPAASIEERNGDLVLVDPIALAVVAAVERHNCRLTALGQIDRIRHFERRVAELGKSPADVIITVLNGDDRMGAFVAGLLMPHDWESPFRAQGLVPFARGLANRDGIQAVLDDIAPTEGERLKAVDGIAVLVADHGIVSVFQLEAIEAPK